MHIFFLIIINEDKHKVVLDFSLIAIHNTAKEKSKFFFSYIYMRMNSFYFSFSLFRFFLIEGFLLMFITYFIFVILIAPIIGSIRALFYSKNKSKLSYFQSLVDQQINNRKKKKQRKCRNLLLRAPRQIIFIDVVRIFRKQSDCSSVAHFILLLCEETVTFTRKIISICRKADTIDKKKGKRKKKE